VPLAIVSLILSRAALAAVASFIGILLCYDFHFRVAFCAWGVARRRRRDSLYSDLTVMPRKIGTGFRLYCRAFRAGFWDDIGFLPKWSMIVFVGKRFVDAIDPNLSFHPDALGAFPEHLRAANNSRRFRILPVRIRGIPVGHFPLTLVP